MWFNALLKIKKKKKKSLVVANSAAEIQIVVPGGS